MLRRIHRHIAIAQTEWLIEDLRLKYYSALKEIMLAAKHGKQVSVQCSLLTPIVIRALKYKGIEFRSCSSRTMVHIVDEHALTGDPIVHHSHLIVMQVKE